MSSSVVARGVARLRGSAATFVEVLLWLFGLGWLRVAADPAPLSLITRIIDPAGAGTIARTVLVFMAVFGAAGIFSGVLWLRRAHLILAAGWWVTVFVLTYQQVTPVHGFWEWLPIDTGAYVYGFVAALTISEAFRVDRRDGGRDT